MIKMKRKLKKTLKILLIISLFLIIIILIITNLEPIQKENNSTDKDLTIILKSAVDDYYNKELKGIIYNVNTQIVSLNALDKLGYDIKKLIDSNCNKDTTYAEVIIENPKETNKDLIKYKIAVYLDCN